MFLLTVYVATYTIIFFFSYTAGRTTEDCFGDWFPILFGLCTRTRSQTYKQHADLHSCCWVHIVSCLVGYVKFTVFSPVCHVCHVHFYLVVTLVSETLLPALVSPRHRDCLLRPDCVHLCPTSSCINSLRLPLSCVRSSCLFLRPDPSCPSL